LPPELKARYLETGCGIRACCRRANRISVLLANGYPNYTPGDCVIAVIEGEHARINRGEPAIVQHQRRDGDEHRTARNEGTLTVLSISPLRLSPPYIHTFACGGHQPMALRSIRVRF
jgi:hypothetical protein